MMRNRNLASLAALLLAIVCASCSDSQPSEPGAQLYVDAWEPMVSPVHADTTYSSVIDASGGEVLIPAADGSPNGYALIVDANTVKQPTRFSVHVLGGTQYVVDLHATQVGPRGVEVDVGKKLLKPVLLCMWYTDSPR